MMKTRVAITSVGSWYGMEFVGRDGQSAGRVLGRDCMPHLWKTRKGAERYAERRGMELVELGTGAR